MAVLSLVSSLTASEGKVRLEKQITILFLMSILLFVQGCAYREMTYFRKHGATVADERADWGLCGGNYLPGGQLESLVNSDILKCMSEKGYQSLNDYYFEQQISFVNRMNPTSFYIPFDVLDKCGFNHLQKGVCSQERYILKQRVSQVLRCMSFHGYEATPPRYKSAYRIIEERRGPSPNFCLTLTPKNGKGGISLGGWRFE
jgi:hypothetical protein